MDHGVTLEDIVAARKRIKSYIHKTKTFTSEKFNELTKWTVFFKAENLQATGSFKVRGALNCILLLKERKNDIKGVVTHSSGNHGQAVAWAAKISGLDCCVVVPRTAPRVKAEAIKDLGAELIFCEPNPTARSNTCDQVVQERGYEFIPSSDHPDVIAGQGTIALELLEEVPNLDTIIVSASGGGMISGIAIAAKSKNKDIKVYMVEPDGKMAEKCIRSGKRLWPNPPQFLNTIADGIILQQLSHLPFKIICDLVEKDVITVNNEDIINGMRFCFQHMKLVIEGAAGATVAAAMSKRFQKIAPSVKNLGVILCGGNVDLDKLPWILQN